MNITGNQSQFMNLPIRRRKKNEKMKKQKTKLTKIHLTVGKCSFVWI